MDLKFHTENWIASGWIWLLTPYKTTVYMLSENILRWSIFSRNTMRYFIVGLRALNLMRSSNMKICVLNSPAFEYFWHGQRTSTCYETPQKPQRPGWYGLSWQFCCSLPTSPVNQRCKKEIKKNMDARATKIEFWIIKNSYDRLEFYILNCHTFSRRVSLLSR